MEYPQHLHREHQDLPLCPEHMIPPGSKCKKLLTTLYDKEKYVIHYRMLQLVLGLGLKLKVIHIVLKFNQKAWLAPYVEYNTLMRTKATNEFEKNFYKLMVNAVFGKTMEDKRKRTIVRLKTHWSSRYGAEALIASPQFHSRSIFAENLVAIQLANTKIVMNKPIYVGFCVLELSKVHMYSFHYLCMRKWASNRCKLMYTDTDSLIYEFRGVNPYDIMKKHPHWFDTFDSSEDNAYGLSLIHISEPTRPY